MVTEWAPIPPQRMNWRLLTPESKRQIRRHRFRRNRLQKRRKRRLAVVDSLAAAGINQVSIVALVSGQEALELRHGHLHRIKFLGRLLQLRRLAQTPAPGPTARPMTPATPEVTRPTRILREHMRSIVFPEFVREPEDAAALLPVEAALDAARRAAQAGVTTYQLLDDLHRACGLDWSDASQLLWQARLISQPISEERIENFWQVESFWRHLRVACTTYRRGVEHGLLPPIAGEWGWSEPQTLDYMMPELRLPRALRRDQFLLRMNRGGRGRANAIDFHAITLRPLFVHPL